MHSIDFDSDTRIMHLRLSGHWTLDEFETFKADYKAALAPIDASLGPVGLLSDSRELPVQSAQVAASFTQLPALS